jgi:hypothetical protein
VAWFMSSPGGFGPAAPAQKVARTSDTISGQLVASPEFERQKLTCSRPGLSPYRGSPWNAGEIKRHSEGATLQVTRDDRIETAKMGLHSLMKGVA